MPFVHLHVYSAYSLLESTLSIKELVTAAQEKGYKAIALTDKNIMYGAVAFYKECIAQGIKPIIGLTADILDEEEKKAYPIILLARNNQGYQNLLKISSAIQTKSPEGLPTRWLKGYSNGLIALTPGEGGMIENKLENEDFESAARIVEKYKKIFGEEFYLSLSRQSKGEKWNILKKLAYETETKLVANHHTAYLNRNDTLPYLGLKCIKENIKIADLDERDLPEAKQKHLANSAEIVEWYDSEVEALQNTLAIADKCSVKIPFHQQLLPKYPVPDSLSAHEYLKNICHKGLMKRYDEPDQKHYDRLRYELSIIAKMNFSDYFLIVWDFMNYAAKNGILTGPGRGSAAGSMVAYVLGITNVDPLKYNLLFERFLNPERITMPDIDIDFPDNRREEMIRYVAGKYGDIHVAQIITFGTFGVKAALRDAGRVFGLNAKELEQLSRAIPSGHGMSLERALSESAKLRALISDSKLYAQIYETALKWEGLPRHTSIHAAGIVMTDQALTDYIPIQEGHDGVYLTQYPMDILEEIGLLKMDFLGLRNLTLLNGIVQQVQRSTHKKFRLEEIPLDDPKTFELLSKGKTSGIFQFESEGMQSVLKRLKPTHFEDLVAVNALYRPGPMDNIPTFINRKHGNEKVTYPHSDLEPILKPTYGIIVYQEQIMQIAAKMAGFSLGEADLLRRAVSKKKSDVLNAEREHFVSGAIQKGYDHHTANMVYDLIVRFANYGFNRSHAVAYSMIAYQLAYLKANHFLSFMAGILTSVIGNEDKMAQYVQELKGNGYELYPPSINKSQFPFIVENEKGLRYSLAAIKGIGGSIFKEIVKTRNAKPFVDLFDFCVRVPSRVVNRKILENLCYAGCFDEFELDRASLLASLDVAIEHTELVHPNSDEPSFFDEDDLMIKPKYITVDPMPAEEKLKKEKQVLGLYLSDHPLSSYSKVFKSAGAIKINSVTTGNNVLIGVYIHAVKTIRTKKGDAMAFLTISDETMEVECVAFPAVFKQYSHVLKEGEILLLEGKMEVRDTKSQFILKKVINLKNEDSKQLFSSLYIKITTDIHQPDVLANVKKILSHYRGNIKVFLHYEKNSKTILLSRDNWVNPSRELITELEGIVGLGNALYKED